MARKIRVYELARELGLTNKEGLELCLAMGIGVSSHSSSIEEAQADRVRRRAERDGLKRAQNPEEAQGAPSGKAPTSARSRQVGHDRSSAALPSVAPSVPSPSPIGAGEVDGLGAGGLAPPGILAPEGGDRGGQPQLAPAADLQAPGSSAEVVAARPPAATGPEAAVQAERVAAGGAAARVGESGPSVLAPAASVSPSPAPPVGVMPGVAAPSPGATQQVPSGGEPPVAKEPPLAKAAVNEPTALHGGAAPAGHAGQAAPTAQPGSSPAGRHLGPPSVFSPMTGKLIPPPPGLRRPLSPQTGRPIPPPPGRGGASPNNPARSAGAVPGARPGAPGRAGQGSGRPFDAGGGAHGSHDGRAGDARGHFGSRAMDGRPDGRGGVSGGRPGGLGAPGGRPGSPARSGGSGAAGSGGPRPGQFT
ncbi:MAG: translation initiation factor IF-2 N-terminal domain-containing protein, partial [Acidimicrobiales bacterium]